MLKGSKVALSVGIVAGCEFVERLDLLADGRLNG